MALRYSLLPSSDETDDDPCTLYCSVQEMRSAIKARVYKIFFIINIIPLNLRTNVLKKPEVTKYFYAI